MASSTLVLKYNSTATRTYLLVSTTQNGARYMMSGRPIATPYVIELNRKINVNGTGNDHVSVRIARTEQNVTSGKLATSQILCDFSIAKDQSILNQAAQKELGMILASLLMDGAAVLDTPVSLTAVVEGRDI